MSKIVEKLIQADNKGLLLEQVVEDLLNDHGYKNVKRQNGGSQYGYDIICYKSEKDLQECLKVECKNLRNPTGINDLAPKLIWHIKNPRIDRFIIVSVNGISNDVRLLLEQKSFSFPIEVWSSDYLEYLVSQSPKALSRLQVETKEVSKKSEPEIFPSAEVKFHVVYNDGEPFSIDYFKLGERLIKAYTPVGFQLTVKIGNPLQHEITVTQLNIKTVYYSEVNTRILRQYKQKGIIEPIKFKFAPKAKMGGVIPMLENGKLIAIGANSTEYINLELEKNLSPGYYEFIVQAIVEISGNTRTLNSNLYQLNAPDKTADSVNLCIIGQYYDTPVESLLKLDAEKWELIKNRPKNSMTYLGDTDFDLANDRPQDKTWKIRELQGKLEKEEKGWAITISNDTPSEEILDTEILIEEYILRRKDFIGW